MKVLFATYPMAFHTPGGGEVQLDAYRRHLPAHGAAVTLMNPWRPRFLDHDVFHFFSCVGGSHHLCAFVKELGLPLVVSSSLWLTERTKGDYPIGEIRTQLGLADRVIVNSDLEGETLGRVLDLPREKFVTVYNGVDERAFTRGSAPAFRRRFDLSEPFVLNVGNIEPRKNQVRLAEAMRAFPDHKLVLIGHARDASYLEDVLAVGGDQVRYLGPLPPRSAALRDAYRACAAFALPSMLETPGLAALEAAAQDAPLVLTREGSAREYFGDAASYVDPGATDEIAAGLRHALAVGRAQSDGDTPQLALVRARFTWNQTLASLVPVYEGILGQRR